MTKFFSALAYIGLGLALLVGMTSEVQAQAQVDCSGLSRTACDAAKDNIRRAPYVGPIRPAQEPMACARVVSYGPAPVEWVDTSSVSSDRWYDGRLITSTAVVYTESFPLDPRFTVTESCIPRRLLRGVQRLTLCTGLHADAFHWPLSAAELQQMQRTGHFSSYVPFLTVRDRQRLDGGQVTAAYQVRYLTQ